MDNFPSPDLINSAVQRAQELSAQTELQGQIMQQLAAIYPPELKQIMQGKKIKEQQEITRQLKEALALGDNAYKEKLQEFLAESLLNGANTEKSKVTLQPKSRKTGDKLGLRLEEKATMAVFENFSVPPGNIGNSLPHRWMLEALKQHHQAVPAQEDLENAVMVPQPQVYTLIVKGLSYLNPQEVGRLPGAHIAQHVEHALINLYGQQPSSGGQTACNAPKQPGFFFNEECPFDISRLSTKEQIERFYFVWKNKPNLCELRTKYPGLTSAAWNEFKNKLNNLLMNCTIICNPEKRYEVIHQGHIK